MKTPLVSIIIPTYNRAHLITETLDSISAQAYTNWECIVVDDGSTDHTYQVLVDYCNKDARIQYHHRPKNRLPGGNAARNYGFELSKGEYVNWLDSDDVITNCHLEKHVHCHKESNVNFIVTDTQCFIDSPGNLTKFWSKINTSGDVISEMIKGNVMWAIGSVTWKRDCINENHFDEELTSSQEWTAHLIKLINDSTYKIFDKVTYLVREHNERIGGNKSPKKYYSTFMSRFKIMELLIKKSSLTQNRELYLLNSMLSSLRSTIYYKYYSLTFILTFKFIKLIIFYFPNFSYKIQLIRTLVFGIPIYAVFRKGYRLFKI